MCPDTRWNHGKVPSLGGETRGFYLIRGPRELSAAYRYTTRSCSILFVTLPSTFHHVIRWNVLFLFISTFATPPCIDRKALCWHGPEGAAVAGAAVVAARGGVSGGECGDRKDERITCALSQGTWPGRGLEHSM